MKPISTNRTVSAQANDDADIREIILMRTCSLGIWVFAEKCGKKCIYPWMLSKRSACSSKEWVQAPQRSTKEGLMVLHTGNPQVTTEKSVCKSKEKIWHPFCVEISYGTIKFLSTNLPSWRVRQMTKSTVAPHQQWWTLQTWGNKERKRKDKTQCRTPARILHVRLFGHIHSRKGVLPHVPINEILAAFAEGEQFPRLFNSLRLQVFFFL